MTLLTPEQLFEAVSDVAPSRDPLGALELGASKWSAMRVREPNAYDAETCRLLYLCALELEKQDIPKAEVWRVRALARFTLLGWTEGVAAIFMGRAFSVLALENSEYVNGATLDVVHGSLNALAIIDELEPFAQAPGSGISVGKRSPSPALIKRFLHEKRGFLLLLLKRYEEARASYSRAAEAALGSSRGELKVRAGAALVEYLDALASGSDVTTPTNATAEVHARARDSGEIDIERTAMQNVQVMRNLATNLRAYEIL